MKDNPLISVIIPVYNNVAWLKKAVESVLNQTFKDFEIIVINDGSTEDFTDFINEYKGYINYYKNENHGVAYSRNYGIKKAKGKYVAFLDSDDYWDKNKLEIQLKTMEDTNSVWSQHSYRYFYEGTNKTKKIDTSKYREHILKYLFTSCKVQTSCFMVRREEIIANNIKFDEQKKFGEDNVFYIELAKLYPIISIDECLANFRIHGTNAGKNAIIQIYSRKDIFDMYGNEQFFKEATNISTRFAYRLCKQLASIFPLGRKTEFWPRILYIIPWVIFKFSSRGIREKLSDDFIRRKEV